MKKKVVKKEKVALVNINQELYNRVKEKIKYNSIEFPSTKNFVEVAIMRAIGLIKYDIEGIEDTPRVLSTPLEKVVGKPGRRFVFCLVCSRNFLKGNSGNYEFDRICQNCKSAIKQFGDKFNKEKTNEIEELKKILADLKTDN